VEEPNASFIPASVLKVENDFLRLGKEAGPSVAR
jgi:hypothetical protein